MAILGDAAASAVHVRFDGVGAVSLRGRYFWGDRYGDAGICHWKMADEKARSGLRSSVESRDTRVFVSTSVICARTLELRSSEHRQDCLCHLGDAKQKGLASHSRNKLETDGKACGGEAAGDRDCWNAGKIRWAIQAQQKRASCVIFFSYRCTFFADRRSGNGRGGNDKRIDAGVGHCQMKLLDEPVACLKRFEISSRGYLGAHFEARAHVLTVLGRVSGKPTGLLVIVRSFSPGDVVAGFFGFAEQRN